MTCAPAPAPPPPPAPPMPLAEGVAPRNEGSPSAPLPCAPGTASVDGPLSQGCIRREGASEAAPEGVRRLEEVAKAVGGGYCRLQPSSLALGVRGTGAGQGLGALAGGPVPPSLPSNAQT